MTTAWPPGGLILAQVHDTGSWPAEQARARDEQQATARRCPRCEQPPGRYCAAPTGLPASGPHPERLEVS
jgi:hypothetical protein